MENCVDNAWLEECHRVWNLQMVLLRFICQGMQIYSPSRWGPYWEEIAKVETTEQAKAFLTKHGFLEKYYDYKKGVNKK